MSVRLNFTADLAHNKDTLIRALERNRDIQAKMIGSLIVGREEIVAEIDEIAGQQGQLRWCADLIPFPLLVSLANWVSSRMDNKIAELQEARKRRDQFIREETLLLTYFVSGLRTLKDADDGTQKEP